MLGATKMVSTAGASLLEAVAPFSLSVTVNVASFLGWQEEPTDAEGQRKSGDESKFVEDPHEAPEYGRLAPIPRLVFQVTRDEPLRSIQSQPAVMGFLDDFDQTAAALVSLTEALVGVAADLDSAHRLTPILV